MFDSTVVVLELRYLLHMSYPHAQCAHTHWRGVVRGIMRMHNPTIILYCIILYYVDPLFRILGCNVILLLFIRMITH